MMMPARPASAARSPAAGFSGPLTWEAVVYALLAVFRRASACAAGSAFSARDQRLDEKAVISFFGIRGLGSVYYLAYAPQATRSSSSRTCSGATTGLIVLISIVLHGMTVTPVMRHLDRQRQKRGDVLEAMCPTDVAPAPASVASKLERRPCLTPPPAAARRSRDRPERDRGCGAGRSGKPRRPPASSPRRAGAADRTGAR